MPLLFGMGVAFDIYYVMAWKAGERDLLSTAMTRGMLFSTLTTFGAFGTLALSSHPGTASMGVLLTLSLFYILVAVLLTLPAMLHTLARPGSSRLRGRRCVRAGRGRPAPGAPAEEVASEAKQAG